MLQNYCSYDDKYNKYKLVIIIIIIVVQSMTLWYIIDN